MMEFHEAANIFPLDEKHLDELAADIRAHGLKVPIETMDGKILDGRRRSLACEKIGVKPRYKEVHVADPISYVLSLNRYRRHLTPSQMAMVGARAREWYDRQAKERYQESTSRAGKASGAARRGETNGVENLPPRSDADSGKARDQAAKAVGVSGQTVDYATKVLERGQPELIQAVDEGRIAVSTAAIVASEGREEQLSEVNHPKRRRRYQTGDGGGPPDDPAPEPEAQSNGKSKSDGVGIIRANEAIDRLKRIPRNDPHRRRGFQIVTDWIKHHK